MTQPGEIEHTGPSTVQAATGPTMVQAAQVDTAVPEPQPSTSGTTQRQLITQLPTFSERVSGSQNTTQHRFFFCYFYILFNEQILTRRASLFIHHAPSRPPASQRLPVRPSRTTGHARCIT